MNIYSVHSKCINSVVGVCFINFINLFITSYYMLVICFICCSAETYQRYQSAV